MLEGRKIIQIKSSINPERRFGFMITYKFAA